MCSLKDNMLRLCKNPWIHVNKSHCPGWSWHLSFWDTTEHLGTLSKRDVQVWELSKWENPSQARSAVKIHGAGVEEVDAVPRLIPGMGSSVTWMSYIQVPVSSRILSRSLNFTAHLESCLFSILCTDPMVFMDVT